MVISLAVAFPDVARYGGYLHAEWTIKWGTYGRTTHNTQNMS